MGSSVLFSLLSEYILKKTTPGAKIIYISALFFNLRHDFNSINIKEIISQTDDLFNVC